MSGFKFPNKGKRVNQHNSLSRPTEPTSTLKGYEIKKRQLQQEDTLDASFGYARYTDQTPIPAFIFNLRETFVIEGELNEEHQAVDIYCLQEDGSTFKTTYIYHPYFLLKISDSQGLPELEEWLGRYFLGLVLEVHELMKEDLDLPNHNSGKRQRYIKLVFKNNQELMSVRRELLTIIRNNQRLGASQQHYALSGSLVDAVSTTNFGTNSLYGASGQSSSNTGNSTGGNTDLAKEKDLMDKIHGDKRQSFEKITDSLIELREYDVPFLQRVCIDMKLRAGLWYDFFVKPGQTSITFVARPDLESRPQMRLMAYDIETCKAPLKFPNSQVDQIMMISLMLDGHGLLITNRQIVSEDIDDFEYTPKPEYEGPFEIINAANERELLIEFFNYIKKTRPQVIVTYNGDFFDFPFVDARCQKHGISMADELAITLITDSMNNVEYKGRFMVHLDAFAWVQRDSYLPQGSQGLKAVTKAKLKYDPIELDPEDMMPFARTNPKMLAQYSVSDAVATYYLYLKYVHLFIFSLCTIIPLTPNEVLRKGSGTLCETLLMVQAYEHNVIAPNKQMDEPLKFYQGHLLESETYVGGHVECLHSGVYRADIPIRFELRTSKLRELMESLDSVLTFAITKEWKQDPKDVVNYQEIRDKIYGQLKHLLDNPVCDMTPFIYHLDVGAMYPNIILTNRLQPYAIVDETVCATCDYNVPNALCKRTLEWTWRGKYYIPTKSDYSSIRASLEFEPLSQADREKFNVPNISTFGDLHPTQQAEIIKNRIKTYSRKVYRTLTKEKLEQRHATTCQREHPFYIDTVRAFRDRRYLYKELNKTWGNNLSKATKNRDALREAQCKDMILLYDSMQLAHKCILNSFYGYVMRKGSRWSSMPMAGVVTRTGAKLIQRAEDLVCAVGKVLELDTDGIWCVLPSNFPENYSLKHANGSSFKMSFPCSVLNHQVDDKHTNHQYHQLPDGFFQSEDHKNGKPPNYDIMSECSIFFEVDGPYKAMVLPASQHEGKNIKKRYAVFNFDGSLAELKGFEIKRRGELQLIKVFQEDVFKVFLSGKDLVECYSHVGAAANKWLDVLISRGQDLEDSVVFNLISENKSMSERLEDYGAARSTSITCAKRLGEFLGPEMVKDKGLNCHFVIVKYPVNAPVSERAVPVKIWDSPEHVKKYYLRQWLNEPSLTEFDIRDLLDWEYYKTRLSSAIQKIISIPAAFQQVVNPVPRVEHPDWLKKQLKKKTEPQDRNILTLFGAPMLSHKGGTSGAGLLDDDDISIDSSKRGTLPNSAGQISFANKLGSTQPFRTTSIFDELDREDELNRMDIEDFDSKAKGKIHPIGNKSVSVKTISNASKSAKKISIDDDMDMDDLLSQSDNDEPSKPTKSPSKHSSSTSNSFQDAADDLVGKPAPAMGTVGWYVLQQAKWVRDAKLRREKRTQETPNQLSTASLVKQLQKEAKRRFDQDHRTNQQQASHPDAEELDGEVTAEAPLRKTKVSAKELQNDTEAMLAKLTAGDRTGKQSQNLGQFKTWHIVSVQPHPTKLGVFNLWALIEFHQQTWDQKTKSWSIKHSNKMTKIPIAVPRVIYINSSSPDPSLAEFGVLQQNRILPHGVPSKFLYEVNMDEHTWQHDKLSILEQLSLSPSVDGIYQHDLSLLFKTVLDLGNMIHGIENEQFILDPLTKKAVAKVWDLAELQHHSNISNTHPAMNSFDRYLTTQQDIHKTESTQLNQSSLRSNHSHNSPTFNPIFIFHRESQDLYLQPFNSAASPLFDKQRVFFGVYDPLALEITIIAAGPGTQVYQNEIKAFTSTQLAALHKKFLLENTHTSFLQWFVSGFVSKFFSTLDTDQIKLFNTSDIDITANILNSSLKINQMFFPTSIQAYKRLEELLLDKSMNSNTAMSQGSHSPNPISALPMLPILDTTQDMALITSLLFHSHQQQQSAHSNQPPQLPFQTQQFNNDYSLAFIIQQYPYIFHQSRIQTSTNTAADESAPQPNATSNSLPPIDPSQNPFSTLQWVSASIQSMYGNITSLFANFIRRLHLSRFMRIPICNIPHDLTLFTLDVLFARSLQDHNHLIWTNPSAVIDNQSIYLDSINNNINIFAPFPTQTNGCSSLSQLGGVGLLAGGSTAGSSVKSSTASSPSLTSSNELELINPQLISPGCYRSICFDLDLRDFMLNALINYTHLPDQAETDTLISIHGNSTDAATHQADGGEAPKQPSQGSVKVSTDPSSLIFRILRNVVTHLMSQRDHFRQLSTTLQTHVAQQQLHISTSTSLSPSPLHQPNSSKDSISHRQFFQLQHQHIYITTQLHHIELLLNNVYRYVTSSQYSVLYDQLLHVYIHKILKKTLIIMVKEISKLHLTIIYSSFERLLVCSDKTHIEVAVNRLQSVLNYVKSQPLFTKLQFSPTQVFYTLLFMDVFNYSGIVHHDVQTSAPQQLTPDPYHETFPDDDDGIVSVHYQRPTNSKFRLSDSDDDNNDEPEDQSHNKAQSQRFSQMIDSLQIDFGQVIDKRASSLAADHDQGEDDNRLVNLANPLSPLKNKPNQALLDEEARAAKRKAKFAMDDDDDDDDLPSHSALNNFADDWEDYVDTDEEMEDGDRTMLYKNLNQHFSDSGVGGYDRQHKVHKLDPKKLQKQARQAAQRQLTQGVDGFDDNGECLIVDTSSNAFYNDVDNDQFYDIEDGPHVEEEWQIYQSFNIASFLPQYAEQLFLEMVAVYLKTPFLQFFHLEQEEYQASGSSNPTQPADDAPPSSLTSALATNLIKTMEPQKRNDWYTVELKRFLRLNIQEWLLEHIGVLQEQQDQHVKALRDTALYQLQQFHARNNNNHSELLSHSFVTHIGNESVFPNRPGKHLPMRNVALEYVKLYCHILSLDNYIVEDAKQVKTLCLTKLKIQPFTNISHYQQPCRTFILPNVCCTTCGYTKDIDLCRDMSLFIAPTSTHAVDPSYQDLIASPGTSAGKQTVWSCQHCHSVYNRAEIESRLIVIIQHLITQYQQQDFICSKCKTMKADQLSSECLQCTITYSQTKTYRQQQQIIISLHHIAKQHGFMFLSDMLDWVHTHR